MKKNDLIIYFIIVVLFVFSLFFTYYFSDNGELVKIYVDKKIFAEYLITDDGSYNIEGIDGVSLLLNISNGSVSVSESTCHDKICKNSGQISKTNEAIICLPGRIVISIDSSKNSDYDSISR